MVAEKDQMETIITAFHETRHAYQCLMVEFGEQLPFYNEVPKERIEKWRYELNDPIQPKGTEENDIEYLSQDTELDAIAFAHYFMQKTFGAESHIPTIIKTQVLQRIEELKTLYDKRIKVDF